MNEGHIQRLNHLWESIFPNRRRNGGMITAEWGEIGFQGSDPATDFRGMGLLGLVQLLYFTTNYPSKARKVLLSSNHPRRFYPFAATGINITSLILEFLNQQRFHEKLLHTLEKGRTAIFSDFRNGGPSENLDLIEAGTNGVHELYCLFFYEFHLLWEARDPPNVMSFQAIYVDFKRAMRKQFPSLEEI